MHACILRMCNVGQCCAGDVRMTRMDIVNEVHAEREQDCHDAKIWQPQQLVAQEHDDDVMMRHIAKTMLQCLLYCASSPPSLQK